MGLIVIKVTQDFVDHLTSLDDASGKAEGKEPSQQAPGTAPSQCKHNETSQMSMLKKRNRNYRTMAPMLASR